MRTAHLPQTAAAPSSSQLQRLGFVSTNLLRLQGLYLACAGLAVIVWITGIELFCYLLRHEGRAIVLTNLVSLPLAALPVLALVHYKRNIGFVYYSRIQVRAVERALLLWGAAGAAASALYLADLWFSGRVLGPVLALNLTLGLALVAQWWVEGRRRILNHYLTLGVLNVGVALLPAAGLQLSGTATAWLLGPPKPFFDYITLGGSLVLLGLLDHRLLMSHLKKLPKEAS